MGQQIKIACWSLAFALAFAAGTSTPWCVAFVTQQPIPTQRTTTARRTATWGGARLASVSDHQQQQQHQLGEGLIRNTNEKHAQQRHDAESAHYSSHVGPAVAGSLLVAQLLFSSGVVAPPLAVAADTATATTETTTTVVSNKQAKGGVLTAKEQLQKAQAALDAENDKIALRQSAVDDYKKQYQAAASAQGKAESAALAAKKSFVKANDQLAKLKTEGKKKKRGPNPAALAQQKANIAQAKTSMASANVLVRESKIATTTAAGTLKDAEYQLKLAKQGKLEKIQVVKTATAASQKETQRQVEAQKQRKQDAAAAKQQAKAQAKFNAQKEKERAARLQKQKAYLEDFEKSRTEKQKEADAKLAQQRAAILKGKRDALQKQTKALQDKLGKVTKQKKKAKRASTKADLAASERKIRVQLDAIKQEMRDLKSK